MAYRELTYLSVAVRILVAIIIGGLVGLERGMKNRPAGLRTYMLVSVGACLIMLTNQYIYQYTGAGDPMRLGAQVVSGIGFLGAGTIVVTKHNQIKGLTTAAGLWASAAVGLALGIGFYEAALTASVGIYAILTVFQHWEHKIQKRIRYMEVYVELLSAVHLSEFSNYLRAEGLEIQEIQFESIGNMEDKSRGMVITLKSKTREDHYLLRDRIRKFAGVVYLEEL